MITCNICPGENASKFLVFMVIIMISLKRFHRKIALARCRSKNVEGKKKEKSIHMGQCLTWEDIFWNICDFLASEH